MNFIPIDPTLTANGAFASLLHTYGEQDSKPVPLTETDSVFHNFRVLSDSISSSVAAKLGVGSIFNSSVSAQDQGFFFDAMTFADKYREQSDPSGLVYATRWGVGLRVLLRVYNIRGDASLNFGTIGASVELQQASAQYEIQGFGIGLQGLTIVLNNLPVIGEFNYEVYSKLSNTIVPLLAKFIEDNATTLQPQPVAVYLSRPLNQLGEARTIYFAMRCIADKHPLSTTLTWAGITYNKDTIREVYVNIAGNIQDTDTPSAEAAKRAEEWLKF